MLMLTGSRTRYAGFLILRKSKASSASHTLLLNVMGHSFRCLIVGILLKNQFPCINYISSDIIWRFSPISCLPFISTTVFNRFKIDNLLLRKDFIVLLLAVLYLFFTNIFHFYKICWTFCNTFVVMEVESLLTKNAFVFSVKLTGLAVYDFWFAFRHVYTVKVVNVADLSVGLKGKLTWAS